MCNKCDFEDYLEQIEDMLNDDDFRFAKNTLAEILEWIKNNNHITDKQTDMIENIWDSRQ